MPETEPGLDAVNITYSASLACPSCGHGFRASWSDPRTATEQRCSSCGHMWSAAFPGFEFEPVTVILPRTGGLFRDAHGRFYSSPEAAQAYREMHAGE